MLRVFTPEEELDLRRQGPGECCMTEPKKVKEEILCQIAGFFSQKPEGVAAYIFGSFLREDDFHDIDVAVLLKKAPVSPQGSQLLKLPFKLAGELERAVKPRLPFDIKLLWIEEVAGVNCQEATREELLETLTVTLREALEFNRREALEAAGEGFEKVCGTEAQRDR